MRDYTKYFGVALLPLALNFTNVAMAKEPLHIPPQQQEYKNRSGNEFMHTFTAKNAPQGTAIEVDCDDMMPFISNGKFNVAYRWRFLARINHSLPAVEGGPSQMNINKMMNHDSANTTKANAVAPMLKHLIANHKVPEAQINAAAIKCKAIRAEELGFNIN